MNNPDTPYEYSTKEKLLITYFGMREKLVDPSWDPHEVYKSMALKAFTNNMKGNEVESVRLCLANYQNIARLTEKFDEMIIVTLPICESARNTATTILRSWLTDDAIDKDDFIKEDVLGMMTEAYITGLATGGMDSDLFHEALQWFEIYKKDK